MDATLMTLHCDHCRQTLGPNVQRYWRMRFCSAACKCAYQQRLQDDTRCKIGRLDTITRPTQMARPAVPRMACDPLQRLAG
jgi:hypothetical protein